MTTVDIAKRFESSDEYAAMAKRLSDAQDALAEGSRAVEEQSALVTEARKKLDEFRAALATEKPASDDLSANHYEPVVVWRHAE